MDEMQTKIDELKETMPSETYRQLCQETKRVRESQTCESLFEVKYTANTIISSHYRYFDDEEACKDHVQCNLPAGLVQTKVVRGKKGANWRNAGKEFVFSRLMLDSATGELNEKYHPGVQFWFGKPGTDLINSPHVALYTITEIKPFTNKRNRTA